MKRAVLAAALLLVSSIGADAPGARAPPFDAALETTEGKPARLASRLGRPTVLFYEDRDSAGLNGAVKDALVERGRDRRLRDAVQILAVANLEGFNNFIARGFALRAVQKAEAQAGVPFLVDWNATLSAPPWNFPKRSSTVAVLDAEGRLISKRSGRLSTAAREALFAEINRLVAEPPKPEPVNAPESPASER